MKRGRFHPPELRTAGLAFDCASITDVSHSSLLRARAHKPKTRAKHHSTLPSRPSSGLGGARLCQVAVPDSTGGTFVAFRAASDVVGGEVAPLADRPGRS